jgi:hypothetical protein
MPPVLFCPQKGGWEAGTQLSGKEHVKGKKWKTRGCYYQQKSETPELQPMLKILYSLYPRFFLSFTYRARRTMKLGQLAHPCLVCWVNRYLKLAGVLVGLNFAFSRKNTVES